MALDKLNHLYREVILDHAQHPQNKRELPNPSFQMELLNPTCGDAIIVQVNVKDDIVTEIAFSGHGCSISMASASMMTQALMGQKMEEAIKLVEAFNDLLKGHEIDETTEIALKDAYFLKGIKQFPARYKCAVLSWKAFEGAVHNTDMKNFIESEE